MSSSSSSGSCLAEFGSSFVNVDRDPFETTLAIERFHRWTPRFGHSNDMNQLLEGSNQEQSDYLQGLLAASAAIFALVLIWTCWLLLSKCFCRESMIIGVKRKPLVPPTKPTCGKPKRKLPFQHNGVAAGYVDDDGNNVSSPTSNGIGKKLREKKRRIEAQQQKNKSKYAKMRSTGDLLEEIPEDEDQDDGPSSPTALESALGTTRSPAAQSRGQSTIPTMTTATTTNTEDDEVSEQVSHSTPVGGSGTVSSSVIATEIESEKLKREAWNTYYRKVEEYQQDANRQALTIYRVRLVLVACFLGIVVSAILFMVMGMTGDGLQSSVSSVYDSLNLLSGICETSIEVIDSFQERQVQVTDSTQKFLLEVNDICPNVSPSLCTNIEDDDISNWQCDFSSMPIGSALEEVFVFLQEVMGNLFENLDAIETDLVQLMGYLDQAQKYYPKHFGWAFWVAAGSSMGLAAVCLYLLGITVRLLLFTVTEMTATKNEENDHHDDDSTVPRKEAILPVPIRGVRSWLVLPLLLSLAILSWVFSMIFVTGSIGTADFCVNSPDQSILTIMNQLQSSFDSSLVPLLLTYYIRGCPSSALYLEQEPGVQTSSELQDFDGRVQLLSQSFLPSLEGLAQAVDDPQTQAEMEVICNGGGPEGVSDSYLIPFLAVTKALETQFCVLAETVEDIRILFSCDTWYPVYEEMVHNAICYHANSGLSWAAATQFVIVVLVLIILTLRVGYYEFDELANPTKLAAAAGCCGGRNKKGTKMADDEDDEQSTSEGE